VQVFRTRLHAVIGRAGLAPSAFARTIGIDRSTLSQLLSPDNERLPRAETLAAIAASHGASVDWLLGLTSRERIGAEVVEQVLQIEGAAGSPTDDRFLRWYAEAEAAGYRIRTAPRSFPDFLKTEEVIRYEYAAWPEVDAGGGVRSAQERLERLRRSEVSLEACAPLQALEGFARGEGQWDGLAPAQRRAQLDEMAALCRDLYPSLRLYLYDLRRTYSAPFTVFGPQRAILYLGTMFFVLTSSEHVRVLHRRFDDLVRAAVIQPPEVPEVVARLPP
jgi:transcriptional regulator with XRE-family HTH domain